MDYFALDASNPSNHKDRSDVVIKDAVTEP